MKYCVGLCYSGYVWHEVEASSEEEARDKAVEIAGNTLHDPVITDWERWTDADQIVVPD
jgi:phosphoribosylformylglycinamidine (FGAM) synthase PurS component